MAMPDDQQRPPESPSPEPFAVPLPEAMRRLGDKCRSGVYDALARGRLKGVKDGTRLLITTRSIDAYMAGLADAKFTAPKPRNSRQPPRKRQKK
jgi:hypothetical protein